MFDPLDSQRSRESDKYSLSKEVLSKDAADLSLIIFDLLSDHQAIR